MGCAPTLPHSTVPRSQMATITQAEPVLGRNVMGTFSFKCSKFSFPSPLLPTAARSSVMVTLAQSGHSRLSPCSPALAQNNTKFPLWQEVKKYTSVRMVKCWNRMHRVVVDSLNSETFKASLDGALSTGAQWKLSLHTAEGWAGWILKISSNIKHFVIL